MKHKKGLLYSPILALCMALCLAVGSVRAANNANLTAVGEIALSKGVVTARSELREITSLGKGSTVYLGDTIETASRSFAVIRFADGGKVTLRPESRFDINEYDGTEGQEKQSFEIIKGGLRAVTGAIGKSRPESVTYTARNTTIGIRGTTFVVKLCDVGTEGCNYIPAGGEEEVSDKKFVDIFVVDKSGGQRQRITRRELRDLLVGVYISVIEGAIRIDSNEWFIEMSGGDKCLVSYGGGGTTSRESDEVECFLDSPGIEGIDVFLGPDAEKITAFNLFDDSEIFVGSEICEID